MFSKWRTVLLCSLVVVGALLIQTGGKADPPTKGKGPVNNDGKAWLIRYHRANGNPRHGGKAVRLKIDRVDNNTISGRLKIYRSVSGASYGNAEVDIADLRGPAPGHGRNRERAAFELQSVSQPNIKVKAFFVTGREKADSSTGRTDDMIVIRVIGVRHVAKEPADDCDETPPDEDVLTEEDETPEPPVYDGGP